MMLPWMATQLKAQGSIDISELTADDNEEAVFFVTNRNWSGDDPYIYAWTGETKFTGDYPGAKMTYVGTTSHGGMLIYKYVFETAPTGGKIIISQCDANGNVKDNYKAIGETDGSEPAYVKNGLYQEGRGQLGTVPVTRSYELVVCNADGTQKTGAANLTFSSITGDPDYYNYAVTIAKGGAAAPTDGNPLYFKILPKNNGYNIISDDQGNFFYITGVTGQTYNTFKYPAENKLHPNEALEAAWTPSNATLHTDQVFQIMYNAQMKEYVVKVKIDGPEHIGRTKVKVDFIKAYEYEGFKVSEIPDTGDPKTIYLYNVGTGKFIHADRSWGVQATLKFEDYGLPFKAKKTAVQSRSFNPIQSGVDNGENCYTFVSPTKAMNANYTYLSADVTHKAGSVNNHYEGFADDTDDHHPYYNDEAQLLSNGYVFTDQRDGERWMFEKVDNVAITGGANMYRMYYSLKKDKMATKALNLEYKKKVEAESGTLESGTLSGEGAGIRDGAACSGGKFVGGLDYGGSLTLNVSIKRGGKYKITISYMTWADRDISIKVGNGNATTYTFTNSNSWDGATAAGIGKYTIENLQVTAGDYTIVLQGPESGYAPNIDCLEFELTRADDNGEYPHWCPGDDDQDELKLYIYGKEETGEVRYRKIPANSTDSNRYPDLDSGAATQTDKTYLWQLVTEEDLWNHLKEASQGNRDYADATFLMTNPAINRNYYGESTETPNTSNGWDISQNIIKNTAREDWAGSTLVGTQYDAIGHTDAEGHMWNYVYGVNINEEGTISQTIYLPAIKGWYSFKCNGLDIDDGIMTNMYVKVNDSDTPTATLPLRHNNTPYNFIAYLLKRKWYGDLAWYINTDSNSDENKAMRTALDDYGETMKDNLDTYKAMSDDEITNYNGDDAATQTYCTIYNAMRAKGYLADGDAYKKERMAWQFFYEEPERYVNDLVFYVSKDMVEAASENADAFSTTDKTIKLELGFKSTSTKQAARASFDEVHLTYLGEVSFIFNEDYTENNYGYINEETSESIQTYIKRKFTIGQWNTFVFPVNLTKKQIEYAFGSTVEVAQAVGLKTDEPDVILFKRIYSSESKSSFDNNAVVIKACTAENTSGDTREGSTTGQLYLPYYLIKMTQNPNYASSSASIYDSKTHQHVNLVDGTTENFYIESGMMNLSAATENLHKPLWSWGTYRQVSEEHNNIEYRGTYFESQTDANAYLLGTNGTITKMFHVANPQPVKGFRFWIVDTEETEIPSGASRDIQLLDEDGTTSLIEVPGLSDGIHQNSPAAGSVYSLQGQLVRSGSTSLRGLPAGVYVVTGSDGRSSQKITVK